jgi:hypothetical protein
MSFRSVETCIRRHSPPHRVMRGLGPRIHEFPCCSGAKLMDARAEHEHDSRVNGPGKAKPDSSGSSPGHGDFKESSAPPSTTRLAQPDSSGRRPGHPRVWDPGGPGRPHRPSLEIARGMRTRRVGAFSRFVGSAFRAAGPCGAETPPPHARARGRRRRAARFR